MTNNVRAIFPLLKAPVTDRGDYGFTLSIGAQYGSPTSIRIPCDMAKYDIRDGDILTVYTEVLLKGTTNAS